MNPGAKSNLYTYLPSHLLPHLIRPYFIKNLPLTFNNTLFLFPIYLSVIPFLTALISLLDASNYISPTCTDPQSFNFAFVLLNIAS